ncbi:MAG: hypothetical protein UV79_C0001G0041 [candidate division TM6 bacterium GW2011_GWF2_43_17]|nr:MAG: hypothetical protein UV79_C0001G0041 [candidate division TM6 bacterium GW2011_GWF2_43_17]HAU30112.1 hypothetical protein [Candidatus Dependentiae bacterium]
MKEIAQFLWISCLVIFCFGDFLLATEGIAEFSVEMPQKVAVEKVTEKKTVELGSLAYEKLKRAAWAYARNAALSFVMAALYRAVARQLEK